SHSGLAALLIMRAALTEFQTGVVSRRQQSSLCEGQWTSCSITSLPSLVYSREIAACM
ncbi:hypothetical protein BaRGS_00021645, partial [Batillaria attramentaria]